MLAVLVSSTTTLLLHFRRGTRQVEEEAKALCVASGLLTDVRASSPPAQIPKTVALDLEPVPTVPPGAQAFVDWEKYSEGLARATIRLTWTGRRGKRRIELTTLVEWK